MLVPAPDFAQAKGFIARRATGVPAGVPAQRAEQGSGSAAEEKPLPG